MKNINEMSKFELLRNEQILLEKFKAESDKFSMKAINILKLASKIRRMFENK